MGETIILTGRSPNSRTAWRGSHLVKACNVPTTSVSGDAKPRQGLSETVGGAVCVTAWPVTSRAGVLSA